MYPPLVGIGSIVPTVLQRVTDTFESRIDAMQNEDIERLWNQVSRGALVVNNAITIPALALQQGPEQVVEQIYPFIDKIVTYYVEFRFQYFENLDSLVTFQYYLGKLQARLFGTNDNITLGGLCVDVRETNANPEIESDVDPLPGGMLTFQARYRHWNGDPYHLPRETPSWPYGQ